MTSQEIYNEHGFYQAKNFIPRFFADYLKEILHTHRVNDKLEKGDAQVGESLCVYGDPAFDTFALLSAPLLSGMIGKTLVPTYTYARIYLNDAALLPHTDRKECEHSVTLFLGGNYTHLWPIWMKKPDKHQVPQMCALEEGDCVIYKGSEVHHWRDHFEGTDCYQLFMHFVESDGEYKDQIYDTRPYIGLPSVTKRDYGHTDTQQSS
jgi:hypothetical protein